MGNDIFPGVLLEASTFVLASLVLQAPDSTAVTPPSLVLQFVLDTSSQKKHASVVHNELTIKAGSKQPYLSAQGLGDFEAWGDISMPEAAHASLLLYTHVDSRWKVDRKTAIPLPSLTTEWQPMKIVCVARHLVVSIGGATVVDKDLADDDYGPLGFEVDSGALSLRKWRAARRDAYLGARSLSAAEPDAIDAAKMQESHTPQLRQEVKPRYTADAMRRHVQGEVELEAIVELDGSVSKVWVARSLDPDLDWEAVYALRRWRFDAGTVDGRAVRCRISVVMDFTLK